MLVNEEQEIDEVDIDMLLEELLELFAPVVLNDGVQEVLEVEAVAAW